MLATAALVGLGVFVLAGVAVQFLRADLDWLHAPMSFYLLGPYGVWLQIAYFALAGTLVLLGTGYYRALSLQARSGAPLLLFAVAAVALCVTAIADSNLPRREPTLQGWMHGVAAQTAFLCVTTAMLLQSWRLRGDARWRRRFALAFALAAIAFIAVWVLAFWRDAPRGLAQKTVVALIVGWLALATVWLRRHGSATGCVSAGEGALLPPTRS
ncbi:uncharacterized protein DUF998 [Luteimonas cucumeris]|uniref:Uncharacterized protein DUF998 n=2 Tax=Luteimonas cucumeris TaxID=985012 RepID=A0A562LAJ6_9GAMM|nr:uncharacterized protein DUF998 [Luteimonas cucumeris]